MARDESDDEANDEATDMAFYDISRKDGLQVRAQRVHVVLLPLAHEERAHHAAHHEHARPRGAQLRDRGRGHGQEGGAHGVAPVVEQRAERRRRALLWQNEKKNPAATC